MSTALLSVAAAALLVPASTIAHESRGGDDATMKSEAKDMAKDTKDAASDLATHVKLETKLAASGELSALAINTDVKDGVVHMKGEVETDAQKEMATQMAKSIEGVKSVKNELKITDKEPGMLESMRDSAGDAALTAKVKTRLLASDNTSGLAINVTTEDDVVVLSGEVDSETERELAVLIAGNTSGVEDVRDNLRIDQD
jgi:osmotically-inducible protein OsmY